MKAGQSVQLANFTIVAPTEAAAESAANALVTTSGFGGQAAAFLSASQASSLANFLWGFADATCTPFVAVEGQPLTNVLVGHFDVAGTPDPNYTATIYWGDGGSTISTIANGMIVSNPNGGFDVYGTYTYVDEKLTDAPFRIVVTDDSNPAYQITATNPSFTVIDPQLTNVVLYPGNLLPATGDTGVLVGPVGELATFYDPGLWGTENPSVDFTATISWGDGQTSAGTVVRGAEDGDYVVDDNLGHIYNVGGNFTVSVTITHDLLAPVSTSGQSIDISTVDLTPPTVTLTAPLYTNNNEPSITVSAIDNVGGSGVNDGTTAYLDVDLNHDGVFTGDEIGYLTTTITGGIGTFTFTSPLPDGSYTMQARVSDEAGNVGTSPLVTMVIDTVAPTVTINQASTQADPTSNSPILFSVVFSEYVTDFVAADVTLGGTAGASVVSISPTAGYNNDHEHYDVSVSGMANSGTVTATILANQAHDQAGNGNQASTSTDNTVTFNSLAPTVTINQAATQADPTNISPINFTVVFGQPVGDFLTGDVDFTGSTTGGTLLGTVTNPSGDKMTYNVAVTGMGGSGIVTAKIDAGVAHSTINGLPNPASTSTDNSVTYDVTAPTVTINQAAGQADPTPNSPILFSVVFSEVVTGFVTGEVTLSGTAGATTAVVTNPSGDQKTYSVSVTGMTTSGTVTATILPAVAFDAAGNGNLASTSTDNTVVYDMTGRAVTINQAAAQADPTNASPILFTVSFTEPVTNFDNAHNGSGTLVTLGGTAGPTTVSISNPSGDGKTFTVAVSGMTQNGTVTATIPAGVVLNQDGNPNLASTSIDNTVTYDTTAPVITTLDAAPRSAALDQRLADPLQPGLQRTGEASLRKHH